MEEKAFPRATTHINKPTDQPATMEHSAFEKLTNLIEDAKTTMPDSDYMELMNAMKTIHDKKFFATTSAISTHQAHAPRRIIRCGACGETGHTCRSRNCPIVLRRQRICNEYAAHIRPFKQEDIALWNILWAAFQEFRKTTQYETKNLTAIETEYLLAELLRIASIITTKWVVENIKIAQVKLELAN